MRRPRTSWRARPSTRRAGPREAEAWFRASSAPAPQLRRPGGLCRDAARPAAVCRGGRDGRAEPADSLLKPAADRVARCSRSAVLGEHDQMVARLARTTDRGRARRRRALAGVGGRFAAAPARRSRPLRRDPAGVRSRRCCGCDEVEAFAHASAGVRGGRARRAPSGASSWRGSTCGAATSSRPPTSGSPSPKRSQTPRRWSAWRRWRWPGAFARTPPDSPRHAVGAGSRIRSGRAPPGDRAGRLTRSTRVLGRRSSRQTADPRKDRRRSTRVQSSPDRPGDRSPAAERAEPPGARAAESASRSRRSSCQHELEMAQQRDRRAQPQTTCSCTSRSTTTRHGAGPAA